MENNEARSDVEKPKPCTRCHGEGRVIIAYSCMGPHIYETCPVCCGRPVLGTALAMNADGGLVVINSVG